MTAIRELEIRVSQSFFKERKKPTFHMINCGRCGDLTEVTGTRQKFCRPCAKEAKAEQDKAYHSDPKYREKHRESDKLSHKEGRKRQRESRPSRIQQWQIKRLEGEIKKAGKVIGGKVDSIPLFPVGEEGSAVVCLSSPKPKKPEWHLALRPTNLGTKTELSFDARTGVEFYGERPYQKLRKITHPNPNS